MSGALIIIGVYLFLVGSCVASFINVVIDRVPQGKSIVSDRSHCDACQHPIKAYDLIPVISYILLRGKCRYCKQKIGLRSFLIECLGGLMMLFCFYRFGVSWMTPLSFLVFMILLAITMIDFDTMTIPNGLVISLSALAVLHYFICPELDLLTRVIGMVSVSGIMLAMTLMIPDSFGGGDIKLMAASGFLLGWANNLLAAFIGILIAGVYATYLLMTKKNSRKDHIAFGPYLSIGIYLALLYGNDVIRLYLSLFHL